MKRRENVRVKLTAAAASVARGEEWAAMTNHTSAGTGRTQNSTRALAVGELRPADILLSRGDSLIARAIVAADAGSYSHAAIWSGSNVIEATSAGISEVPLGYLRHVYRRRELDNPTATKVVEVARSQRGGRYAYHELLLLGLLFALGIEVRAPLLDRLLEAIGGPPARELQRWLQDKSHEQREPRICTELVASCYYQANSPLRVVARASRPSQRTQDLPRAGLRASVVYSPPVDPSQMHEEELRSAQRACLELLLKHRVVETSDPGVALVGEPQFSPRKVIAGAVAVDDRTGAPVGTVTPADLEFSPSLERVGFIAV